MHVIVEAERRGHRAKVTEAEVVYVAIAVTPDGRRPVPILAEESPSSS
jgi:acyl-CoA hydrolase